MDQNALEKIGIDFENGIGRFAGMFHTMHALKSVSGTLGMTELFDCCAAVTTAIRAGKTGGIEEMMAQAGEVHDNRVFAKRAFY